MTDGLRLRSATVADAELLLSWRNEAETRRQSKTTAAVSLDGQLAWLDSVLADPDRILMVACDDDRLVGSVRADRVDGAWVLSWMVAADARGLGYGVRIVQLMIDDLDGEIRAEVKPGNPASLKIAERLGMKRIDEVNDMTIWALNKK